jgi:hypothetical protein
MKTFMSVAIAVALTLLVVPAMVDVSAGADESALLLLAEAIQANGMRVVEFSVEGVEFELQPSGPDDPVPSVDIRLRCRDRDTCEIWAGIMEGLDPPWDCSENIFGWRCRGGT